MTPYLPKLPWHCRAHAPGRARAGRGGAALWFATAGLAGALAACHASPASAPARDGGGDGGDLRDATPDGGMGPSDGGDDVAQDRMADGPWFDDTSARNPDGVTDVPDHPTLSVDLGAATVPDAPPQALTFDAPGEVDKPDAIEVIGADVPLAFDAGVDLAVEVAAETHDVAVAVLDTLDVGLADRQETIPVGNGPDASGDSASGPDVGDVAVHEAGASEAGIDGESGPCCGCLCRDPSWSCSKDTCVDTAAHAIGLAAEAGFLELAGGNYVSESEARTGPIQRIWYAFQPAATTPATKPLAVFFNGGPGSATSAYLFSFNTATYTLDPAATGTASIAANPNSWTQFANLLYIDAPGTGFSYPLALADGTQPSVGIDLDHEAGSVLRVIVRFLDRHPLVQANPVIIVGESYGGTRAALLFDHLFKYQSLTSSGASFKDVDLYNDLIAHFAAVWPHDNPATISPSKLATQFGHQVLGQPVVAGDAQWNLNSPDTSVCVASYDAYQCNQSAGWLDHAAATAAQHLISIATLRQALGVDPTTIDWLYASARKKAYGRGAGTVVATPEMTSTFGTLGAADNYFLILNSAVLGGYGPTARNWHDATIGVSFIADLVYVNTFITNAKYDMVVWTPAIAPALGSFTGLISSAVIDSAARTGVMRPGWIEVAYVAGTIPDPATREIRFPFYANGGHTVTAREPANLLADVAAWYAGSTTPSTGAVAAAPGVAAANVLAAKGTSGPVSSQPDQVLYLGP